VNATVEAISEEGIFKPFERPEIPEGKHVPLTVATASRPESEDPLELAARVYRGLRPEEVDEIEQIALARSWPFQSRRS